MTKKGSGITTRIPGVREIQNPKLDRTQSSGVASVSENDRD